jgi:hypothetical protein
MSIVASPIIGSWKKWSITHSDEKPASSAACATSART